MSLLKQFSSNPKLSQEGKEFQLSDDGFITLRRSDSKVVKDLENKLRKPYDPILRNGGKIPEEKTRAILVQVFAEATVVGWRGSDWIDEDNDGSPLEYSVENAKRIFSNKTYEPLLDTIARLSDDFKSFRDEEVEEIAKN